MFVSREKNDGEVKSGFGRDLIVELEIRDSDEETKAVRREEFGFTLQPVIGEGRGGGGSDDHLIEGHAEHFD